MLLPSMRRGIAASWRFHSVWATRSCHCIRTPEECEEFCAGLLLSQILRCEFEDRPGLIPIRAKTELRTSTETTSPLFGMTTGVSAPLVIDQLNASWRCSL